MKVIARCALIALIASTAAPISAQQYASSSGLDSVVLERTLCYGTCPAYRLTVRSNGTLRFQSRNRRDEGAVVQDSVNPFILDVIAHRADAIGFAEFPAKIAADRVLCRDSATDHPTIIIALFGAHAKQVEYYTGCYTVCCNHSTDDSLRRLAQFAAQIDSLTRSSRWVRASAVR